MKRSTKIGLGIVAGAGGWRRSGTWPAPSLDLVECFFHRLKRFRAIATRYEKTGRNFLALVQFACSMLWLESN